MHLELMPAATTRGFFVTGAPFSLGSLSVDAVENSRPWYQWQRRSKMGAVRRVLSEQIRRTMSWRCARTTILLAQTATLAKRKQPRTTSRIPNPGNAYQPRASEAVKMASICVKFVACQCPECQSHNPRPSRPVNSLTHASIFEVLDVTFFTPY